MDSTTIKRENIKIMQKLHKVLLGVAVSSMLWTGAVEAQTKPAAAKAAGAKKPKKKPASIRRAEAIAGKPLTPAQLKTIGAAAKERSAALKKYDTIVARALGMSLEQYKAKEKATRAKAAASAKR
jgi:hypothetical protein